MRRFTLTPQSKKNSNNVGLNGKVSLYPRGSIGNDDFKAVRNVRDKNYKQSCCENIMKFLVKNKYEGVVNMKVLNNPSNKEFQNIFKFIFSFVDYTPFNKFEEDILIVLKIMKYPYSSEITRSQLTAITPHAWPVLLSMISWIVDLINENYRCNITEEEGIEKEFLEYLYKGYERYMEGNEDDRELEDDFIKNVNARHCGEYEENESMKKELEIHQDELENVKKCFYDIEKLEEKKNKLNDDINGIIQYDRQLESKRKKYIGIIEKLNEEITEVEAKIEKLIIKKNEVNKKIASQAVKIEDIQGMSREKNVLLKELERIKPEKENLAKKCKEIEKAINSKIEHSETLVSELRYCKAEVFKEKEIKTYDDVEYSLITELENELENKKKGIVSYEINMDMLKQTINEKEGFYKELEEQWKQRNTKLQTIGVIYLEKKEMSERIQQKNINEVEKIDNDLLRLKLANDNALLKSERDYSEAKIQFDILTANITRVKEEISKNTWEFYNNVDINLKALNTIEKDVKKSIKK